MYVRLRADHVVSSYSDAIRLLARHSAPCAAPPNPSPPTYLYICELKGYTYTRWLRSLRCLFWANILTESPIGLQGFAFLRWSSRRDAWHAGPSNYGREEAGLASVEGGPGDGSQAFLQALLRKACGSHAISHATVWQAGW